MSFSVWLRCPDCGFENVERPFQYTGQLSAGDTLLPYRLGSWVVECMNTAGADRCPTRPVLTASPEAVDAWLAAEPPADDEQAHHAWMAAHPFTVEFGRPRD